MRPLSSGWARPVKLPVAQNDISIGDTLTSPVPIGWPTDGTRYGAAVPSLDNASRFYSEGVCGFVDTDVNVFFFEAFDEPWKPDSIGDDGSAADEKHWGAMNADRTEKYNLKC